MLLLYFNVLIIKKYILKSVLDDDYVWNYVHHHISVLFYNLLFICMYTASHTHIKILLFIHFCYVMICFLYTMMYLWGL